MKYGKIIGILLVICVAITFLGVASAAEVVVNGEKFNIPDNYVKNNSSSSVKKTSTGTEEHAVYDGVSEYISIVVTLFNAGTPKVPEDPQAVDKTINGVSGKYVENFAGTGSEQFTYISNNKLVIITKDADSNVTFEDIVIKSADEGGSGSLFNLFG
ncbi:MAG: hypothetical protein IJF83_14640 [Methanobrevibacter sp.]|nr:hypothetical protein [Methanobrevibacter sp.]MBQ2654788.1 hypothetical protein [Methanobrevibacter sp.]